MPDELTNAAWAKREAAKVRCVLQEKMEQNQGYSTDDLLYLLRDNGLFYTNPEYAPIEAILLTEGLIEAI